MDKKEPKAVKKLIADAQANKTKKQDNPVRGKQVIPESTLFNRLRRRKK